MSFFDHFPGSSLDSRWTAVTGGSGSVSVSDSMVTCDRPAAADAAFIYNTTKIDKTKSQIWFFAMKCGTNSSQIMSLVNRSTAPVVGDTTTVDPEIRVRVFGSTNTPMRLQFRYYDGTHTSTQWNGTSWTTSGDAINAVGVDNFLLIGLEIDGPGARFRLFAGARRQTSTLVDQGYKLSSLTDWVGWSSLESTSDLWLVLGDPYNDVGAGTLDYEFVHFMDGDKVHAWSNGKDAQSGNYSIFHSYGFEDSDDICRFFIMEDRTTTGIGITGKDPFVVFDGTTYHMFFADSTNNIGRATASAPDGTWTVQADVITKGTNEVLGFPFVVLDLDEADSNKRWKLLYSVSDTSGSPVTTTIKYATAPAASGTWTAQGEVIGLGASGADDEIGAVGAVAVWWNNQWEVWYSGMKPVPSDSTQFSIQGGMRATGTDLGSLTKDGSGARITHLDSVELVTANMNPSRTASVSSTSGFSVDQPVYIDNDATADNWAASRVRKINTDSSLELYHLVASFTAASNPKIFGAGNGNIQLREVIQKPAGGWAFYVTQFNASVLEDQSVYAAFREETNLLEHSGTNPTSSTPAWNWQAGIVSLRGAWGQGRSNENISLLHVAHQTTTIEEADGAASGTGTGSGVGASTNQTTGSSAGTGAAAAVGASFNQTEGQASGGATDSVAGAPVLPCEGASAGQAAVTGETQAIGAAQGISSAIATADGQAQATAETEVVSTGAGTAQGDSQSFAQASGSSAGITTSSGIAASTAQSDGASAGIGTAQSQSSTIAQSDGSVSGQTIVAAESLALALTEAQAAGTASALGEGENAAGGLTESDGQASGVATVTGVGASFAQVQGQAAGVATVAGVGEDAASGIIEADGQATGSSVAAGSTQSVAGSVAASTGLGDAIGQAAMFALSEAQASGAGAASGIAVAFTLSDGASQGAASVQGIAASIMPAVGADQGIGSPLAIGASFNLTTGASAGVASPLGVSGAFAGAIFAATGQGAALGEAEDIAGGAVGQSAGIATVLGLADFSIDLPARRTSVIPAYLRTSTVPSGDRTTKVE